jgi:hypothetical protein
MQTIPNKPMNDRIKKRLIRDKRIERDSLADAILENREKSAITRRLVHGLQKLHDTVTREIKRLSA